MAVWSGASVSRSPVASCMSQCACLLESRTQHHATTARPNLTIDAHRTRGRESRWDGIVNTISGSGKQQPR